jgi:hypothetical protein
MGWRHAEPTSYASADGDPDAHTNSDSDSDTYGYAYTDSDTYGYADRDSETNANANANADTGASGIHHPGLWVVYRCGRECLHDHLCHHGNGGKGRHQSATNAQWRRHLGDGVLRRRCLRPGPII